MFNLYFFIQEEYCIRDYKVTGVQTCALPIWAENDRHRRIEVINEVRFGSDFSLGAAPFQILVQVGVCSGIFEDALQDRKSVVYGVCEVVVSDGIDWICNVRV